MYYQCKVIVIGITDSMDPIQMSHKMGYFHSNCGDINGSFDGGGKKKQLWICIQFTYHYNMHFTVKYNG
jgi:hypothetical protein